MWTPVFGKSGYNVKDNATGIVQVLNDEYDTAAYWAEQNNIRDGYIKNSTIYDGATDEINF